MNNVIDESFTLSPEMLLKAFNEDMFRVVYQEKIELSSGQLLGYEVFSRLEIEHTNVPVMMFLKEIRSLGLVGDFAIKILNKVLTDLEARLSNNEIGISINLDLTALEEPAFVDSVCKLVAARNIQPSAISFDIGVDDPELLERVKPALDKMKLAGFYFAAEIHAGLKLSVDEVSRLPVEELKISRSVIMKTTQQATQHSLLKKMASQAQRFSISTTAVGVETSEEQEIILKSGFDYAQGYFFSDYLQPEQVRSETGEIAPANDDLHQVKVLIVEDDLIYQDLIGEILSANYKLLFATNEMDALEIIKQQEPNIVLIDIHLPEGSGLNIAQQISSDYEESHISIVMMSGDDSKDNRVASYLAGAIDFLKKPLALVDLVTKIDRIAGYHKKRSAISASLSDTEVLAFQSMRDASRYGEIVQFMKDVSHARDESTIARAFFKFMGNQGLQSSVIFRQKGATYSFDCSGISCSPTEINVYEILREKGRLYAFGSRLMVNDNHVSFLIKNMPEEESLAGQVRDYVAALVEGMESRYRAIIQAQALEAIAMELTEAAGQAAASLEASHSDRERLIEKIGEDVKMSFHVLDLTSEQESYLTSIIQEALAEHASQGDSTEALVARVSSSVDKLVAVQRDTEVTESEVEDIELFDDGDDIELF
ncbi:MAG: hypothetical protein AseanaTS_08400 [Candidatus Pelagadaptatus aseana]|uniref:EAL domain-containing protein n=1 Tax=Candidatus Pelagadaptatus aseana TaxID=3120508 RepID=UPI0039B1DF72